MISLKERIKLRRLFVDIFTKCFLPEGSRAAMRLIETMSVACCACVYIEEKALHIGSRISANQSASTVLAMRFRAGPTTLPSSKYRYRNFMKK